MPFSPTMTDADAYRAISGYTAEVMERVQGSDRVLGTSNGEGITLRPMGGPWIDAKAPILASPDTVDSNAETSLVNYMLVCARHFQSIFAQHGLAQPVGFDIEDIAVDSVNGFDGDPAGTAITSLAAFELLVDHYNTNVANLGNPDLLPTPPALT